MQNACVQKKNKVLIIIMALLLLLSSFNLNIFNSSAEGQKYPFDKTNVLKDLESSSDFNIYNYPFSLNESERIINFVEFAYSPYVRDDFALYIYLYNPKNIKWSTETEASSIEMAVGYSIENNEEKPTVYDNFNLVFCNKSERAGYEGLFYKFRIVDHRSADGLTIQERVNSSKRRYDVSSIILSKSDGTSDKLLIGGTYRFTGYAKGCDPIYYGVSTLRNVGFKSLETIEVDASVDRYLIEGDNLENYHKYELNSLYFSIPERYFTHYGNLQKITFEWYEYKSTPIFTANDFESSSADSLYNKLNSKVGENITNRGAPRMAFASENKYKIFLNREAFEDPTLGTIYRYDTGYNLPHKALNLGAAENDYNSYKGIVENAITEVQWLLNNKPQHYNLFNYVNRYSFAKKGYLPIKNGEISADLFLDTVDVGRTRGYNYVEFALGEDLDIKSYNATDLLQKWCDAGLFTGKSEIGTELNSIEPILWDIEDSQVSGQNLLINDVNVFNTFRRNAKKNNERTVLLRQAVTDFWQEGFYTYVEHRDNHTEKGELGCLSQKTLLFDNDVIKLTFQTNDTYIDMPIVQNPTAPIESDAEDDDTNNWFTGVIETIGAYGVLIIGIVGLLILAFFIIKAIGSFMPGGTFARVIMIIIVVALGYLGFLLGNWTFATIESLGGLM